LCFVSLLFLVADVECPSPGMLETSRVLRFWIWYNIDLGAAQVPFRFVLHRSLRYWEVQARPWHTCWCMAPVKSKRKDVVESFRQGKVAEPKIHANVLPFIETNTKGLVHVVQTFGVGLVKSRDDHISANSPDAVCALECSTVGLAANDEFKLVRDVRKLCSFLSTTNGLVERKDENDDDVFNFMATMEYKHKSETATQQEARKIVSQVLSGSKLVVLGLPLQNDVLLFQAAIRNVD
jgi:hypothetical protein